MSLDMHIWSCIRANSKYKVATTPHRKRRSSPRLPLPLGSCLDHSHHLVVVVKGKWWFTHLSVGLCRALEDQNPVKIEWKMRVSTRCFKKSLFENCYLYLTADVKSMKSSQKTDFRARRYSQVDFWTFLENCYLHPTAAEKYQTIL